MTDTGVILLLSNVSTASIVGLLAFAALEIRKERDKDKAAEAKADREHADETWRAINESREHSFADYFADRQFAAQPMQQHAALSSAELPALSAESHEDEQAPAEDDDHAGAWWLPLMTMPLLLARAWGYLQEYSAEQVRLIRELAHRTPAEAEETDTEASAVEVETIRAAEPVAEVTIVHRNHRYLLTGEYPMVKVTGTQKVGRHRLVKGEVA